MRILFTIVSIISFLAPIPASATRAEAISTQTEAISSIHSMLHNGNPEDAEKNAYALLKKGKTDDRQRRNLLRVIAVAEEMQTSLHEYNDTGKAIAAWKTLLREFISPNDAAAIRWKIAWLYWKQGEFDAAIRASNELLKESPDSQEAIQGQLLIAKIAVKQNKLNIARKHLLKYLFAASSDNDQSMGLAWMSVVDFKQHRQQAAFTNIGKAIKLSPGLVSSDVTLLSTYVQLLYARKDMNRFMSQSGRFFERYIDRPEALLIRLLYADMLLAHGEKEKAAEAYERLAEIDPGTSVGIRAFMRKMMLNHEKTTDLETLKPVLSSLQKISADNQLSPIEDESMLDQAQLWSRLTTQVNQADEKALDLYGRVMVGTTPEFAKIAKQSGHQLFVRQMLATLQKKKSALETIVLWRRYPQLRQPTKQLNGKALKIHHRIQLGVASAMRELMDFNAAREILSKLYQKTQNSLEGERVMLERAQLWLDRHDTNGYTKIMRWLNSHPFTLYRPEMLMLAADIKLSANRPSEASQTLKQVSEQDIALEMRPVYWRIKAQTASALELWHRAASAWSKLIPLLDNVPAATLRAHADALFKAGEYSKAEHAYLQIPENVRHARWQYQMAVSERYNGKWKQSEERLQALLSSPDAGQYALRARLLLADHQAASLLAEF